MTNQQPSPLTTNVFTAYLDPLLTKHESGTVIVYEDLMASWDAVEAVLSKHESALDASDVVSCIICTRSLAPDLSCLTVCTRRIILLYITERENQDAS